MTSPEFTPTTTYFRGRVALAAILRALGIGRGDEVATQAFTCVAVPEGVMATGARSSWIDVDHDGYTMSAADLRTKITPRTRAVLVQHTYGIPADMDPILDIAREAGLPVIEDCCHTFTSTYRGALVGTLGTASFYSYEWGKPIVAGLGGGAVANDPALRERLLEDYAGYSEPGMARLARIQAQYNAFGLLFRPRLYWPVRAAFRRLGSSGIVEGNYNPVGGDHVASDFHLRMAPALEKRLQRKLALVPEFTRRSGEIVEEYVNGIRTGVVIHPTQHGDRDVTYARYPLRAHDKRGLLAAARQANVELAEWFVTPVHPLQGDALRSVNYNSGSCPNAEAMCEQVVSLPTHNRVTDRDVQRALEFFRAWAP